MLLSVRRLTKPQFLTLTLIAVIVVTGLALSATAGKSRAVGMREPGGEPAPAQARPAENVESELLTLRNFGFEPAALRRPAGEVIFVINNRSRWRDLTLTLNRVQGNNKVKDVGLRKGQINWLEKFNLPPGDYVLTAAGQPELSCNITLTPR